MARAHAGVAGDGIFQVHPTRRCNLACAHCYSASSPRERDQLAPAAVAAAIVDAAALGFGIVSLSGGEPLLYDGLDEILAAAERVGSRVNLVSNGALIATARYARAAGRFGVVALSLDGLAARHDRIRGARHSFAQVQRAAALLRAAGQPFGVIHTLCAESLSELEDVAALASEWGATLLQLHPFEPAGRGAAATAMTALDAQQRLDALLLAAVLGDAHPRLRIQLDLVHRLVARRAPAALHGAPLRAPQAPRILVLEPDGVVVPLTYGLDRAWAVVDIGRQRLADAWPDFATGRWPLLRRRLRRACLATARGRHGEVVDWHALVRQYARPDACWPFPAAAADAMDTAPDPQGQPSAPPSRSAAICSQS
ncbi:radical SAM protein [bacterium]|nr:radical SAM protein [bacterium]